MRVSLRGVCLSDEAISQQARRLLHLANTARVRKDTRKFYMFQVRCSGTGV